MITRIVFFDGYCGLCNALVDTLLRIDAGDTLKFAPLQGETASQLLRRPAPLDPDTVVYLRDGVALERSTAVLQLIADLGGPWRMVRPLFWVPRPLRDLAYRIIARNRHRFWKRRPSCRLPTPNERGRLLP